MSDVVFILGAGCSKLAGAPLMNNFIDVASDLYRTGKVKEKQEHFERVFESIGHLQQVHSKAQLDLFNIESVFNAFEIANTIQRLPGYEIDQIPDVLISLKEVIVTTIEKTMEFPVEGSRLGIPRPYKTFIDLIEYISKEATPRRSCSIITFNYDIAIDMALTLSGIRFGYYLDNDLEVFPLLKLHGSLNWASRTKDNVIIPLKLNEYISHLNTINLLGQKSMYIPIGSQLKEYFLNFNKEDVNSEPVIVPPSWNKVDMYSGIKSVWAFAGTQLSEAEYIFIIGYSLPETDSFFRLLYALGTVSNTPFRIIQVLNPDSGEEIRHRFISILGSAAKSRYSYIQKDFVGSIPEIKKCF